MAEKKVSASGDKKNPRSPILESLNFLFYISKVFGMIPYSFSDYVTKKQFKLSQLGNILCVLSCIHYTIHYQVLTANTMLAKDDEGTIGTLTTVIGVIIVYMEPLMFAVDVLASLLNQKSLIAIFERLREIDDKLLKESVSLNYRAIKKYSIILVAIAAVGEVTVTIFNLVLFQDEIVSWSSLYWMLSSLPLFNNCLARTWFLLLILLVQQRLRAINGYLNDTKNVFLAKKSRNATGNGSNSKKDNLFMENLGYLEREIFSTRNTKIKSDNAWNWVGNSKLTGAVNDVSAIEPKSNGFINVGPYDPNGKGDESHSAVD